MNTTIQAPLLRHQCSKGLPVVTASITTHNPETLQAIFCQPEQGSALTEWHDPVDNDQMAFFTLYHTATVPTTTENDLDLHRQLMDARTGGPPLVVPNGVVCRMVDFAPGYSSVDHRSLSIDYGVVIEGTIELILDSGETCSILRGGMTVQRGTSATE